MHLDVHGTAMISIGDGCDIAMDTTIVTSHHDLGDSSRRAGEKVEGRSVVIEPGCWLGAKVVVLPGITIGSGCVVAAGAVVTNDCDPDCLYAGVPARLVKRLNSPGGFEPEA